MSCAVNNVKNGNDDTPYRVIIIELEMALKGYRHKKGLTFAVAPAGQPFF